MKWINSQSVIQKIIACMACIVVLSSGQRIAQAGTATTSVSISICGNAIIESREVCDDGSNLGTYGTIAEGKICNGECSGWGAYCGDAIFQPSHGEECDDGNNVSSDGCMAACKLEPSPRPVPPPPSSGGGGGGGGGGPYNPGVNTQPNPTRIAIRGKGYPNTDVQILKDGKVLGMVKADSNADFFFSADGLTPGISTFGFWSDDEKNLRSTALTVTLQVIANAVTTISGVFIPPTISMDKRSVKQGEKVQFSGTTVPQVSVETHVHSEEEVIDSTKSGKNGEWTVDFDTAKLENEAFHTVRAMFQTADGENIIKSGYSQALSFYVGGKAPSKAKSADINGDGKVNLVDFSIMLFYWGKVHTEADINEDSKINLTDFSILLFYWTG